MVICPVVATFAAVEPEMVPKKVLAITEAFAAPPRIEPAAARARSLKNWAAPNVLRNPPKIINPATMVETMPNTNPQRPSALRYIQPNAMG